METNPSNRHSTFVVSEEDDEIIKDAQALALLEAENGLQQFDEVLRLAEQAIAAQEFELTPEIVCGLNRLAVAGICRSAGMLRTVPIGITNTDHEPPPPEEVEQFVIEMCNYVKAKWSLQGDPLRDAIHLSSYVMWRLNWIHLFRDGNGRTSRAVSYLVLTIRLGQVLRGEPTIPDQIIDSKGPYYRALDDADAASKKGRIDLSTMERLIESLLEKQLSQ
jgi:Fic family protein